MNGEKMERCELCAALDQFFEAVKKKGWAVKPGSRDCQECNGTGFIPSPRPGEKNEGKTDELRTVSNES